jgi:hypothetical protein
VDEKDEVFGFGVSFPLLTKAFQKAKEWLFPFGFIHIVKALYHYDIVDLYLTGVHPDWHLKDIHSLYHVAMNKEYIQCNIHTAFPAGLLDPNYNALGIWNNYKKTMDHN